MIRVIVFDLGDTVMRELPDWPGRMVDAPHVEAMPGIAAALAALQPCYRLAMASNAQASTAPDIRAALRRVGLDGWFEFVLSSADLGVAKPDPAFFAIVLRACGCAPEQAVMVGDTFEKDVTGAKAVGMRAVWYNWKNAAAPPGSPFTPDAEIRDLLDLESTLRALDGR
jgi:putative hydrolase of the HAD superfamily